MGNPESEAGLALRPSALDAFKNRIHARHDGAKAQDCRLMRVAPSGQVTHKPRVQGVEFGGFLFQRRADGAAGYSLRAGVRCLCGAHVDLFSPLNGNVPPNDCSTAR